MRRISRDRVAGLLALGVLVALLAGVPLLLVYIAGWPLPGSMPDWDNVQRSLTQGDISAEVVVNTLAVVVWLMWLQLVWALAWEACVNVPRLIAGHRPRPAPLVAASLGNGVARLVAMVLAVGVAVVTTPAPAIALPSTPNLPTARTQSAVVRADSATASRPAARQSVSPEWKVERSDSLWRISETALGDGERSGEILDLNRWLGSARHLKAGQVLTLPDDASVPTDRVPVALEAEAPAGPAPPETVAYLEPTHIVIEPGDTLWGLSEERLSVVDDDVTPNETLDHLREVIAANADIVEDPNLIYPGEVFAFPAVGTPPPVLVPAPAPPPPPPTMEEPAPPEPMNSIPVATPAPDAPIESSPPVEGPPTVAATMTTVSPPTAPAAVPSTVGMPPLVAEPGESRESAAVLPWLAGVTGTTALASGLLLLYRRRLTVRAARGAGAFRASIPDDPGVLTSIIRASDISLVRWANDALSDLMERLRPGDIEGQPLAVELSEGNGIEMLWTHANHNAPDLWTVGDDGWSWSLAYDPDTRVKAVDRPAALPALVTIGRRNGNQLLLNLEAVGTLAVDGDDDPAGDFIRSIVVEFAVGEVVSDAFLVASGVTLDGIAAVDRVQSKDRDAACSAMRAAVDASVTFLSDNDLRSMFDARLGGDSAGRESTVVVVDDEYAQPLDDRVTPGLGACLVYTGGVAEGQPGVVLDGGAAVLIPYGIEFDPVALPLPTVEAVSDLLDEASEPYVPPERTEARSNATDRNPAVVLGDDDLGDDDSWEPPDPAVVVRVLGAPEVLGRPLGKIETSILVYLACHGGRRRDAQVINAVWNGKAIDIKTLWNRISLARSVLGGELIPQRAPNSSNVVLSERVMTDLDILTRLHARSADVAEAEALDLLLRGLDLIDGVPFDSPEYEWSFESQDHATACEEVESAALRCVDVAMNLGDLDAARRAVTQGLRALPLNEPLYRARARIESASGNPEGARQALAELDGEFRARGLSDPCPLLGRSAIFTEVDALPG